MFMPVPRKTKDDMMHGVLREKNVLENEIAMTTNVRKLKNRIFVKLLLYIGQLCKIN